MIVSAYFFHLWTDEQWANEPRPEWKGLTYVKYLGEHDTATGLQIEMERSRNNILSLREWDYHDPRFLELRYEDMIAEEDRHWLQIFRHYGFGEEATRKSRDIATRFTFTARAKRPLGDIDNRSHLRSGAAGQWRNHFTPQHKEAFLDYFDDILVHLGYETDHQWSAPASTTF